MSEPLTDGDVSFAFFFGTFLGFVLGAVIACGLTLSKYDNLKQEAIRQGYAQYNQTTGKWEWKPLTKGGISENSLGN